MLGTPLLGPDEWAWLPRWDQALGAYQPLWHQLHQREPGRSARLSPGAVPLLKRVHDLHLRLSLAELLMGAALFREESRGGHFRIDAPAKQPFWQRHSVQQRGEPIRTSSQLG